MPSLAVYHFLQLSSLQPKESWIKEKTKLGNLLRRKKKRKEAIPNSLFSMTMKKKRSKRMMEQKTTGVITPK